MLLNKQKQMLISILLSTFLLCTAYLFYSQGSVTVSGGSIYRYRYFSNKLYLNLMKQNKSIFNTTTSTIGAESFINNVCVLGSIGDTKRKLDILYLPDDATFSVFKNA